MDCEHIALEFQSPQIITSSQHVVDVGNFSGNFDTEMVNIDDFQNTEAVPQNQPDEPMEISIEAPPLPENSSAYIVAKLGKSSPNGNCFFG